VANTAFQMRCQLQASKNKDQANLAWLAPVRILVIAFIALGYASTMPRGPKSVEYFNMFGYDPSWYGIQILFMMSGFLALRSLQRHGSAGKFLLSRAGRNLPTLAVFTGLVILVLFPLFGLPLAAGETRLDQHIRYFIKVITCFNPSELTPGLLDNALYMCVVQGGIWTFRWGLVAFVATAGLWLVGGLRDRRILALLTLGFTMLYAAIVVYAVHNPNEVYDKALEYSLLGLRLGFMYLVGMCMYAFKDKLSRHLAIPFGLLSLAGVQYIFLPWTPFIEICADLGLGYLAFIAMTSRAALPKSLRLLPDLSLGLYIYNWPAAQITLLVMPSLTPYPLFAVSFPITIFLAASTWLVVSRKINFSLARRMSYQSA
jgi:hypothetical protein